MFMPPVKKISKIGICTGGGDCPGLNAAIRAVVKYATKEHKIEVYGIKDSFNGLQKNPAEVYLLKIDDVADILHRGGTILGTCNRGLKCENPAGKEHLNKTVEGFKSLNLDAVIVIGGEGTQTMAKHLSEAGIPIVGVPKTIDNDLLGTDQTIGFSSCIDLVSDSVIRLQSTAESHDRIMVLEVMGRDSGYIALHGGLAGGANVILIPEISFSYESICQKLTYRKSLGRNYSVIVVSEGAYPQGSSPIYKQSSGRENLGGIGTIVAETLSEKTGIESRITVLGHLQRGGAPNCTDKILATRFGVHAVDLISQGITGKVVVLQEGKISSVDYSEIKKNYRKKIPLDDNLIKSAENIGVCLGR